MTVCYLSLDAIVSRFQTLIGELLYVLPRLLCVRIITAVKVAKSSRPRLPLNSGTEDAKPDVHEPPMGTACPWGICEYGEFVTVIVPLKLPLPDEDV